MLLDPFRQLSVIDLSSRLFIIPRIAQVLMAESPLLYSLCHSLISYFKTISQSKEIKSGFYAFFVPNEAMKFPGFLSQQTAAVANTSTEVFRAMKYLLGVKGVNFNNFFSPQPNQDSDVRILNRDAFVNLMEFLQGMCAESRRIGSHIEFENDHSKFALELTLESRQVRRLFVDRFSSNQDLETICRILVSSIEKYCSLSMFDAGAVNKISFQTVEFVQGMKFVIYSYDVSYHMNSLYNPLHWVLAQVFRQAISTQVSVSSLLSYLGKKLEETLLRVVHHSLNSIVFASQIQNGLWVRNGASLVKQALQYRIGGMQDCFDSDLLLVQIVCGMVNPDHSLCILMDRFAVLEWFTKFDAKADSVSVEDFLRFLVWVVSTRYQLVGNETEELENEIIHHLAAAGTRGLTYSELVIMVTPRLHKIMTLDNIRIILEKVSVLKIGKSIGDSGRYVLSADLFRRADSSFWHYSAKERQEIQTKPKVSKLDLPLYQIAGHQMEFIHLYQISPDFQNLDKILSSVSLVKALFLTLHYILVGTGTNLDSLLEQTILLIRISLSSPEESLNFIRNASTRMFIIPGTRRDKSCLLLLMLGILERGEQTDIAPFVEQIKACLHFMESKNRKAADQILQWQTKFANSPKSTHDQSVMNAGKARQLALTRMFQKQQQAFSDLTLDEEDSKLSEHRENLPGIKLPSGVCVFCQDMADEYSEVYGIIGLSRSTTSGLVEKGFRQFSPPSADI